MDIFSYNRDAWNHQVAKGNRWTVPVGSDVIAAARQGDWQIVLTSTKPVPRSWFPSLPGLEVLCLASSGGQQGPVLAAAGAKVTVLDASPAQLGQDRQAAEREGLELRTVEGDMAHLPFPAESFGLIVHPCSNCFVRDVRPVLREACRVLRPGGVLMAGFANPILYVVDDALAEKGELQVRHAIPYSDLTSLTDVERRRYTDNNEPPVFGHSLEDQIGGQLDSGFIISGFYEDCEPSHPLAKFLPTFIATQAVKPAGHRSVP